jgi:hypothetical protein
MSFNQVQTPEPFLDAGAGQHQMLSLAKGVKFVNWLTRVGDDPDCPKALTPIAKGNDKPLSRGRIWVGFKDKLGMARIVINWPRRAIQKGGERPGGYAKTPQKEVEGEFVRRSSRREPARGDARPARDTPGHRSPHRKGNSRAESPWSLVIGFSLVLGA